MADNMTIKNVTGKVAIDTKYIFVKIFLGICVYPMKKHKILGNVEYIYIMESPWRTMRNEPLQQRSST